MGAVFKTVVRARERAQVGSTPTRLRHFAVVSGQLSVVRKEDEE